MLTSDMLNPYASFLGNRIPLEVIAETPNKLKTLLATLGPERANQSPSPGKWSAREIVCHLADCETVFAFRIRQALAEENHVVQPFDQDRWAKNYGVYTADEALALFSAARAWNRRLIASLPAEAFAKKLTHPERGEMAFQVLVETMGGHDINHIRQIEAIVGRTTAAH
ncbi:MAG TPA: DinB family protein [Candidatus Acidoferrales bacterium]|nr:DinB family protein [Candidatus Acidoferrales bacterium]